MIGRTHVPMDLTFGIINVVLNDFPAGTTISINNTQNVLRQKITNTGCIYYVKKAGTYTVTASSSGGVALKSATCEITTKKQEKTITLNYILYLIKGNPIDLCTNVTGSWVGASIISGSATYPQTRNGMTPSLNTSGTYLVATNGHNWTGNNFYDGCIKTNNLSNNLNGFSKIVLNYDISLSGSTGAYYGMTIRPFASKTKISSNQTQATNATAINHQNSASNQTQTLTISSTGGYVEVGIGMNQYYNPGTVGTLTIKSMYATT